MTHPPCALVPGDCFRFKNSDPHLWIIVSDPALNRDRVLMVNVTSMRRHADLTCILKPGDHGYIQHDSFIYYGAARTNSAAHINSLLANDRIELLEPVGIDLLSRIWNGFTHSIHAETGHVDLLWEQMYQS